MEKGAMEVSTNGEHNMGIESLNLNSEEEATPLSDSEETKKNNTSEKRVRVAPKVSVEGPIRANHTVPQPFALATEKRESHAHKNEGASPVSFRKHLQPENQNHRDEEDSCSLSSLKSNSQLRKNLKFKATPMPSFYQEGPPPNLKRRKSSGESANSSPRNATNGATHERSQRRNLGSSHSTSRSYSPASASKAKRSLKPKEKPKFEGEEGGVDVTVEA